jgi:hypothetical protein
MVLKPKVMKKMTLPQEQMRDEIISKGGHVAADIERNDERQLASKKEWQIFGLRIKANMLNQIDKVLEDRVGISKTGWILEAIQEKLKRTENERS